MHVILNGERLEGVPGLITRVNGTAKYLGSQVAADGGCEMDVGIDIAEALKSVLSNRGLGIKAKKYLYEGVIVPTSL